MSLSGITGFAPDITGVRIDSHDPSNVARRDTHREPPAASSATTPAPTTAAQSNSRATARGSSVTAPPGTDPELWSILTSEERAFFARRSDTGPLTYAKVMRPDRHATPSAPTARGGRVDIRV